MCRVVDSRIILKVVQRRKPTVCKRRKAAVLGAIRRVRRTPPGSESGACLQRGDSGTWESHLSPCFIPGLGDRVTTSPGVTWGFRPSHEPYGDTTNSRKQARYRGGERQAKHPETGRAAVVAAHSTEEGGEVRPKRPTGGKAPSSRASAGRRQGRDFELTNPDHGRPVDGGARVSLHGQPQLCLRNRMRELRTYGSVGGPDG